MSELNITPETHWGSIPGTQQEVTSSLVHMFVLEGERISEKEQPLCQGFLNYFGSGDPFNYVFI